MPRIEMEVAHEVNEDELIVRDTSNPIDFMAAKPIPTGKFIIYCHASLPTEDGNPPGQMCLTRTVSIMKDYYNILQDYDPFPTRRYGFHKTKIKLPSDHFYRLNSDMQDFYREEVEQILASFPSYLRFKEDMDPIVEIMEA